MRLLPLLANTTVPRHITRSGLHILLSSGTIRKMTLKQNGASDQREIVIIGTDEVLLRHEERAADKL